MDAASTCGKKFSAVGWLISMTVSTVSAHWHTSTDKVERALFLTTSFYCTTLTIFLFPRRWESTPSPFKSRFQSHVCSSKCCSISNLVSSALVIHLPPSQAQSESLFGSQTPHLTSKLVQLPSREAPGIEHETYVEQ
jgi:hypothetical protein